MSQAAVRHKWRDFEKPVGGGGASSVHIFSLSHLLISSFLSHVYFHIFIWEMSILHEMSFFPFLPPLFNAADRLAGDPAGPDPPGQLPDVRVSSVHVREKAVQGRASVIILTLYLCMGICVCFSARKKTGMVGHLGPDGRMLPLLPRGDPDKPRPPPRFSVVDMPKEDLHKQRAIKEVDKKKGKDKENKDKAEEEKDEKDTKGGSEKKSTYLHLRGKSVKAVKY